MNTELTKILTYFNLSEKEARVYLAGLQVGQATVYEIAKAAQLKRPTAYVLVESLIEKGLMTTETKNKKNLCSPAPPRRLLDTWRGRLESLEAITPELNTLFQTGSAKPKVVILEGERGVDAIYNELSPPDTKGEEIIAFGSLTTIAEKFAYRLPVWQKIVNHKRNRVRELIDNEPLNQEYITDMKKIDNPRYQLRVTDFGLFGGADILLYKNKTAILSLKRELFAAVIESPDIYQSFKLMFDLAWQKAKKI
ncbi:MAG: helix-turn-helix domain-containing protein [bacterium]|nr:helix-turn-helix domain-containing protein [bacterium]